MKKTTFIDKKDLQKNTVIMKKCKTEKKFSKSNSIHNTPLELQINFLINQKDFLLNTIKSMEKGPIFNTKTKKYKLEDSSINTFLKLLHKSYLIKEFDAIKYYLKSNVEKIEKQKSFYEKTNNNLEQEINFVAKEKIENLLEKEKLDINLEVTRAQSSNNLPHVKTENNNNTVATEPEYDSALTDNPELLYKKYTETKESFYQINKHVNVTKKEYNDKFKKLKKLKDENKKLKEKLKEKDKLYDEIFNEKEFYKNRMESQPSHKRNQTDIIQKKKIESSSAKKENKVGTFFKNLFGKFPK